MPAHTLSLMTVLLMSFVPPMPDVPAVEATRPVASCDAPRHVLRAESHFEQTIAQMWRRSPTFRRQVARLAAAGLLVTIERCLTGCPSTLRARTTVKHQDGVLAQANVYITFLPAEAPELIAHELEHVIQQLDGVDLARLASSSKDVVHDGNGYYETMRADHVGRLVAAEYRAGVGVASDCERTTP